MSKQFYNDPAAVTERAERRQEVFARIKAANTSEQAFSASIDPGTREEFIKSVFGPKAVGGFFKPTRANVNKKFLKAWEKAKQAA